LREKTISQLTLYTLWNIIIIRCKYESIKISPSKYPIEDHTFSAPIATDCYGKGVSVKADNMHEAKKEMTPYGLKLVEPYLSRLARYGELTLWNA
jgi:hypothetical protein